MEPEEFTTEAMSTDVDRVVTELANAPYPYRENVRFPNGRGVSIIRNDYSYGGRRGLFEVAVLNSKGDLDFSTPVSEDVLGHLTVIDVIKTMQAVADLPAEIEA